MKTILLTVLLVSLVFLGFSQFHEYRFNGVFTELGGGPALSEVLYGGGTPMGTCGAPGSNGSFTTETIITSGGTTSSAKPVFVFTENAGLSYPNAAGLGITGTYTIHILVRKTDYTIGNFSFQRVIDFSNGTNDDGLYSNFNGGIPQLDNVYGVAPHPMGAAANLLNNQYYLISLVRGAGSATNVDFYLDGNYITSYADAGGIYASNGTDPIIFFRDDISAPANFHCESGPGAIRYLSLSSATSNATQVMNTWLSLFATVILPVNLSSFSAQKSNTDALLQWQTNTEINTAYFNVERSYDGITFNGINKINAKGLSSNTYTYNDVNGLSSVSTNTYYRLKIVDATGNFKYSSTVRLANGREAQITVFPNPSTDVITISGLKNNDIIKLLSIDGKVLSQQTSKVQSLIMNIERYRPGTYIIQVQSNKESTQQKIVKY